MTPAIAFFGGLSLGLVGSVLLYAALIRYLARRSIRDAKTLAVLEVEKAEALAEIHRQQLARIEALNEATRKLQEANEEPPDLTGARPVGGVH